MSVRWAVIERGLDATDDADWPSIAALVGAGQLAVMTAEHGLSEHAVVAAGRQPGADILSTSVPGMGLVALAADCVPVALEAPGEVVVIHAGWRGVLAGTVSQAVDGRAVRRAFIGPAICARCYEVSAELAARFVASRPAAAHGRRHLDLVAGVIDQLGDVPIEVDGRCTLEEPGLYSYRGGDEVARGGVVAVLA